MRIITKYPDGSVPLSYNLLDAILFCDEVGPREGVSAFVDGVMAGWGAQLAELDVSDIRLGHAPPDIEPFGPETLLTVGARRSPSLQSTVPSSTGHGMRDGGVAITPLPMPSWLWVSS